MLPSRTFHAYVICCATPQVSDRRISADLRWVRAAAVAAAARRSWMRIPLLLLLLGACHPQRPAWKGLQEPSLLHACHHSRTVTAARCVVQQVV
jgi:hypothetical protein